MIFSENQISLYHQMKSLNFSYHSENIGKTKIFISEDNNFCLTIGILYKLLEHNTNVSKVVKMTRKDWTKELGPNNESYSFYLIKETDDEVLLCTQYGNSIFPNISREERRVINEVLHYLLEELEEKHKKKLKEEARIENKIKWEEFMRLRKEAMSKDLTAYLSKEESVKKSVIKKKMQDMFGTK